MLNTEIYIHVKELDKEYEINYEIPPGLDYVLLHKALTKVLKMVKANIYWQQTEIEIKARDSKEKYEAYLRRRDNPQSIWAVYHKAKESFEYTVQKMQNDIQTYAASGKANQKAIDIRLSQINQIVAYYQAVEEHVGQLDWTYYELCEQVHKITVDRTKLCYLCMLYGVDPYLARFLKQEDLETMLVRGRQFRVLYAEAETKDKFKSREQLISQEYEDYREDTEKLFNAMFLADRMKPDKRNPKGFYHNY